MLERVQSCKVKISIGMPVCNGASFIREALDSILAQTFTDYEVLISDNKSIDDTAEICREYARRDSRIRYIYQNEDIGVKRNFSITLHEASGKYFTWLAHDDYLLPNFLEFCVSFLEARPSFAAVSGDFRGIDADGNLISVKELKEVRCTIPWNTRIREFFRYPISNAFFVIYGVFRREMLLKAYDDAPHGPLLAGSEIPLLVRLAVLGEIGSIEHVLRAYRYHRSSSYQKEQSVLKSRGIFGSIDLIRNKWWKRIDQITILLISPISAKVKVSVIFYLFSFYMSNFVMNSLKFLRHRLAYYQSKFL